VTSTAIGTAAAYALARFRFRGQRSVIMFLIITQMFPLVLLCIPYFQIVVYLGLYDTLTALILVYTTFTLPFCILMLRSYFAQIPKEMEEAAMVDGCSRLGAIIRTLLPMSFPALVGAGLYTFLLAWNEFLFAVVLIESWDKRVITMAIYSLLAEFVTEWSMMMAFSVLASAPLVVTFSGSYRPNVGDSFDILDWSSVSGLLTPQPTMADGNVYNWSYNSTTGAITLTSIIPEPATLVLLCAGLGGVISIRRRRAAK